MLDYEDYLRQHSLLKWDKDHPRIKRLRTYLMTGQFMTDPMRYASRMNAEEYCNLCITLINQATYDNPKGGFHEHDQNKRIQSL